MNPIRNIIVGVDGSAPSLAALRWAVREGRLHNVAVRVVYAWSREYPDFILGVAEDESRYDEAAEEIVQQAVASLTIDERSDVTITTIAVDSHPRDAILAEATSADLIVVGSRGRGSATAALLGSTSHALVHHAPCAVLVVKGDAKA